VSRSSSTTVRDARRTTDAQRGVDGFRAKGWIGPAVAMAVATVYVVWMLTNVAGSLPAPLRIIVNGTRGHLYEAIRAGYTAIGVDLTIIEYQWGAYLVIAAGAVPWLAIVLLGRWRPRDIGLRAPNRIGWRVLILGYVAAVPFLVWMALSPGFGDYYASQMKNGWVFVEFYLVNMMTEHLFFHGVLLAAFRPGLRWPAPPPVVRDAVGGWRRRLQWIGLAQPRDGARGLGRVTRWIGLPDGCVPAILASALLFAAVHIGKDARELVLSAPGGVALAYIAYRTNSLLTPLILHTATAATAAALLVLLAQ
jgi:membrane protease YdiL (CAAX protease family)